MGPSAALCERECFQCAAILGTELHPAAQPGSESLPEIVAKRIAHKLTDLKVDALLDAT